MERRTDTLSRIDEILRPVEDLENRIRDRIFNRHLESRVAVGNVTTFRETPRDSLHPLGEIFWEGAAPAGIELGIFICSVSSIILSTSQKSDSSEVKKLQRKRSVLISTQ